MTVKRYSFNFQGGYMEEDVDGEYITYMDYVSLNSKFIQTQSEKDHLSEYTDHLVAFTKLPCLPKDLENLRETNAKLAEQIHELELSRDSWMNRCNNIENNK